MAGHSAFGTWLCISTSTARNIANLTGISGPGISLDTIDVTAHDSADAFREFVAGVADGGEVSFEGNLVSAAKGNEILTELANRKSTKCSVHFAVDPATTFYTMWYFHGIFTGFETDAPFDDKIGFSASIKVTGKPTLSS